MKVDFNKPVYSGDSLNISGVVAEKKELFHRVKINAKVTNQFGEKVSSAKITVGILNE
jgi:acyl dehydratase